MSTLNQQLENTLGIRLDLTKWSQIYCYMCPTYGTTRMKKKKAGVSVDTNGIFRFNCFECKYKAKYNPARPLSSAPNKNAVTVLLKFGFKLDQLTRTVEQYGKLFA